MSETKTGTTPDPWAEAVTQSVWLQGHRHLDAHDVDVALRAERASHAAELSAKDAEIARLKAERAEAHDVLSGFEALTDPDDEHYRELHARTQALLDDSRDHAECRVMEAACARGEAAGLREGFMGRRKVTTRQRWPGENESEYDELAFAAFLAQRTGVPR